MRLQEFSWVKFVPLSYLTHSKTILRNGLFFLFLYKNEAIRNKKRGEKDNMARKEEISNKSAYSNYSVYGDYWKRMKKVENEVVL